MKIVVLGDTSVGKTSLIVNYLDNQFDPSDTPSNLGIKQVQREVNKQMIDLEIHDTFVECIDRSLDDYPKYKSANLFLLCVAADDRDSFDSITTWKREILKIS